MGTLRFALLANVTEPGDIALYAIVLGLTLVVGLTLLGIDTIVGRLRRRGAREGPAPPPRRRERSP